MRITSTVIQADVTPFQSPPVFPAAGWWDSSQENSLIVSSTGRIKAWLDLSGQDNHLGIWSATAAGDDPGPLYGSRTINSIFVPDLQGNMRFAMQSSTPRDDRTSSTFVVIEADSVAAGIQNIIGADGTTGLELRRNGDDLETVTHNTLLANFADVLTAATPTVVGHVVTATTITQYRNTGSEQDANATALTAGRKMLVGGDQVNGQPWDGAIAEIIYFDRTLETVEINAIVSYLMTKWGIS